MLYEFYKFVPPYIWDMSVDEILENYDISIIENDLLTQTSNARIIVYSNNKKAIYLNSNISNQKREYCILHELGHLLLEYNHGIFNFSKCELKGKAEWHADLFAAFYLLNQLPTFEDINILSYFQNNGFTPEKSERIFNYIKENALENDLM